MEPLLIMMLFLNLSHIFEVNLETFDFGTQQKTLEKLTTVVCFKNYLTGIYRSLLYFSEYFTVHTDLFA